MSQNWGTLLWTCISALHDRKTSISVILPGTHTATVWGTVLSLFISPAPLDLSLKCQWKYLQTEVSIQSNICAEMFCKSHKFVKAKYRRSWSGKYGEGGEEGKHDTKSKHQITHWVLNLSLVTQKENSMSGHCTAVWTYTWLRAGVQKKITFLVVFYY